VSASAVIAGTWGPLKVREASHEVDEQAFNALYAATAGSLWSYVARVSGSPDIADDVLQEAYYRFLSSKRRDLDTVNAKPYLFRIATNLMHDRWRRSHERGWVDYLEMGIDENPDSGIDVRRVMLQLKPRARELLWLAYVEGMTHREIAVATGLNTMSVRILLLRARRKAALLLGQKGKRQ